MAVQGNARAAILSLDPEGRQPWSEQGGDRLSTEQPFQRLALDVLLDHQRLGNASQPVEMRLEQAGGRGLGRLQPLPDPRCKVAVEGEMLSRSRDPERSLAAQAKYGFDPPREIRRWIPR